MPKIKFVLENSAGPLAESSVEEIEDVSDLTDDLIEWTCRESILLTAGDVIRIVQV